MEVGDVAVIINDRYSGCGRVSHPLVAEHAGSGIDAKVRSGLDVALPGKASGLAAGVADAASRDIDLLDVCGRTSG